ncbi:MAG: hypothetical protein SVR08_17325 [Spirochaetota bacterium]|nr:hypothetical protein [Spirochaetota bacterium]
MKVSIEGILGTATRMESQIQSHEKSEGKKKQEIKADSLDIRAKINTRVVNIQKELKDIQSSLTKSQIIQNGVSQLIENLGVGRKNRETIFNNAQFENQSVLREFIGNNISNENLNLKLQQVGNLIREDVHKLRRLEIEVENILASNIASKEINSAISSIESALSRTDLASLSNISNLSGNIVMNLLK